VSLTQLSGELPPDEAHVWLVRLNLSPAAIETLAETLNPDEQSRAARFKVNHARDQFVVSHAFLRMILGKYLQAAPQQLTFRLGPQGKPELAKPAALHFNLSHTNSLAAVAVTRAAAIGVDVERVRENVDSVQLAERYFSKREADWVRAHPVSRRAAGFFSCWTAKEAYIKAIGGGLSIALDGFAIVPDPKKLELELEIPSDPAASGNWTMRRLELPAEFRGAVAVNSAGCRVHAGEVHRW
jgi:4'-phosphopantetheinyl transferase